MSNLYQLTNEVENFYLELENHIDFETGEIDAIISNQLSVKEEEFNKKAIAVGTVARRFENSVNEIDAEIKRLTALKKRLENVQDRLKNSLTESCLRLGKEKIEGISANISFRKSEKTIIEDESLIPEEFINVSMVKKPDLTRIKEAIKRGFEVPGAIVKEIKNIQIK